MNTFSKMIFLQIRKLCDITRYLFYANLNTKSLSLRRIVTELCMRGDPYELSICYLAEMYYCVFRERKSRYCIQVSKDNSYILGFLRLRISRSSDFKIPGF